MANLANVTRYISAGFQRLDFHVLDSSGLPAGVTGTVTAGATGVPAGRITGVKTAAIITPDGEKAPVTGDNTILGTFLFPNVQARGAELEFAEDDFADRRAMQGILSRNIGNHSFAGRDALPFAINNMMIIGVSNAKAQTPGVVGLGMYAGIFSRSTQMLARGRSGFTERQAATMSASITFNAFDAYAWGETFQVANEGYNQSFVEDWTYQYPVTCHRWTQTGATTKFFLGETPAATTLSDVLVYVIDTNGIPTRQTANVTISAVDNSITFSIAPTNGYSIVAWYGYIPS